MLQKVHKIGPDLLAFELLALAFKKGLLVKIRADKRPLQERARNLDLAGKIRTHCVDMQARLHRRIGKNRALPGAYSRSRAEDIRFRHDFSSGRRAEGFLPQKT